jgi:hypothetical protein
MKILRAKAAGFLRQTGPRPKMSHSQRRGRRWHLDSAYYNNFYLRPPRYWRSFREWATWENSISMAGRALAWELDLAVVSEVRRAAWHSITPRRGQLRHCPRDPALRKWQIKCAPIKTHARRAMRPPPLSSGIKRWLRGQLSAPHHCCGRRFIIV